MSALESRILIQAPFGRDALVIERLVTGSGTPCVVCPTIDDLRERLDEGAGGVIITEEALCGAGLHALLSWFKTQPAWSDLACIVLATRQTGRRSAQAAKLLEGLGNVILLERPVNAETLTSAVASVLRGRRRQYEARALLLKQEQTATALKSLNETLEQRIDERARELEGTRKDLAFALDSAGMGSWSLNLSSNLVTRSEGHDRLFGYVEPLGEFTWRTFYSHIHEDDLALVESSFEQALLEGTLDLECRIRTADQKIRWIASKGRTDYNVDGSPRSMAGVVMDVTERRMTEEALHQSQKMEAIGQLTGGVAHDFNNLLTVIVGGLDIVIRNPESPERNVRLAEAAMTAARRGEQLTQQLLAFSRRQVLRPETANPNRLLLDFHGLAQRAVGEAIALEYDLDPGIDPVRVDPVQFEAAVLNLMVNARDAMPSGGRIVVRSRNVARVSIGGTEKRKKPTPHVLVSVTDNGTGIEPTVMARAFEPFFTTKEVGKGSGLGLAQVYGFARSAHGDASIESTVGRGTAVNLFLPSSSEVANESRSEIAARRPLGRAEQGETVLLVEDDPQVLEMARESLSELNYTVAVARNGREALDFLAGDERIDILFSDVVMPGGMSGAQLAVKAKHLRPELKILLTSGYVGIADNGQIGDNDLPVLSKPYRRDELANKLRMVLESGR